MSRQRCRSGVTCSPGRATGAVGDPGVDGGEARVIAI